jgi:hypothetical protein
VVDADDLVLSTETHEDIETLLFVVEMFCQYAKIKVDADEYVSISVALNREEGRAGL